MDQAENGWFVFNWREISLGWAVGGIVVHNKTLSRIVRDESVVSMEPVKRNGH
jgi:hypothetical protein